MLKENLSRQNTVVEINWVGPGLHFWGHRNCNGGTCHAHPLLCRDHGDVIGVDKSLFDNILMEVRCSSFLHGIWNMVNSGISEVGRILEEAFKIILIS